MGILDTILSYLRDTGFGQFHWTNGVMLAIGGLFIFLAVVKKFEPLLLVPIGFGILIGNIPYDASKLSLGVYDGPVSESDLAYYEITVDNQPGSYSGLYEKLEALQRDSVIQLNSIRPIESRIEAMSLLDEGRAIVVNQHAHFALPMIGQAGDLMPFVMSLGQGRHVVASEYTLVDGKPAQLWSLEKQDVNNASIFWWLFTGVGLAGFYPPLIFLGIGALTDFGPMLGNPKTILLGAAAQFGIFASLLGAVAIGFDIKEAASIGIIGGADGPTAIFTASQLAPDLLGAVALAAYSYMAMVPIIQPPIIKLLTTKKERLIRMGQTKTVSKRAKILFPIVCFVLTAFIAPGGLPLLGMLFLGNLLRESMVTERLAKTAQTTFIDIITILLGVTVGAKTSAANFLTAETIGVFCLGIGAFVIATGTGVLAARLINFITSKTGGELINPMIGAAGVSAVPMAARVVHVCGQKEDPQNFLLMHAMGPNVAGVIGSAIAAGVLLSQLGG